MYKFILFLISCCFLIISVSFGGTVVSRTFGYGEIATIFANIMVGCATILMVSVFIFFSILLIAEAFRQ